MIKIIGYESVCIFGSFLLILISLKDKLVDSYIDSKLSNNNSKDLFNNFKQIGPDGKVSREFIE
jgi:hypothetical protein